MVEELVKNCKCGGAKALQMNLESVISGETCQAFGKGRRDICLMVCKK